MASKQSNSGADITPPPKRQALELGPSASSGSASAVRVSQPPPPQPPTSTFTIFSVVGPSPPDAFRQYGQLSGYDARKQKPIPLPDAAFLVGVSTNANGDSVPLVVYAAPGEDCAHVISSLDGAEPGTRLRMRGLASAPHIMPFLKGPLWSFREKYFKGSVMRATKRGTSIEPDFGETGLPEITEVFDLVTKTIVSTAKVTSYHGCFYAVPVLGQDLGDTSRTQRVCALYKADKSVELVTIAVSVPDTHGKASAEVLCDAATWGMTDPCEVLLVFAGELKKAGDMDRKEGCTTAQIIQIWPGAALFKQSNTVVRKRVQRAIEGALADGTIELPEGEAAADTARDARQQVVHGPPAAGRYEGTVYYDVNNVPTKAQDVRLRLAVGNVLYEVSVTSERKLADVYEDLEDLGFVVGDMFKEYRTCKEVHDALRTAGTIPGSYEVDGQGNITKTA